MTTTGFAEYIWLDGTQPTQKLRSKARFVSVPDQPETAHFPEWSFDGSSTNQAEGDDSDCLLVPARIATDPRRGAGNWLVLCEVLMEDLPAVVRQALLLGKLATATEL